MKIKRSCLLLSSLFTAPNCSISEQSIHGDRQSNLRRAQQTSRDPRCAGVVLFVTGMTLFTWYFYSFNPFTPESDQCQNSPAASQEIWHHTVWRTWLFIAYSDEKWLYYKFSLHHSYNRFLKGWENTLFELRSERVKKILNTSNMRRFSTYYGLCQTNRRLRHHHHHHRCRHRRHHRCRRRHYHRHRRFSCPSFALCSFLSYRSVEAQFVAGWKLWAVCNSFVSVCCRLWKRRRHWSAVTSCSLLQLWPTRWPKSSQTKVGSGS